MRMSESKMLECECGCRRFRRESIDVVEVLDIEREGNGISLQDILVEDPTVDQSTSFECLNCGKKFGDDLSELNRVLVVIE